MAIGGELQLPVDSFGVSDYVYHLQSYLLPRPEQFTQRTLPGRAGGVRGVVGRPSAHWAIPEIMELEWDWLDEVVAALSCENPRAGLQAGCGAPAQGRGRREGPWWPPTVSGPRPRPPSPAPSCDITSAPARNPASGTWEVLGADHLGVVHDFVLWEETCREASTSSTRGSWWQRRPACCGTLTAGCRSLAIESRGEPWEESGAQLRTPASREPPQQGQTPRGTTSCPLGSSVDYHPLGEGQLPWFVIGASPMLLSRGGPSAARAPSAEEEVTPTGGEPLGGSSAYPRGGGLKSSRPANTLMCFQ